VDAHFYAWLNTHFCHPGVCFFKKLQWSETFGKLQLTSAIEWTHYDFPLFSSFTQRQTWHSELWSRRHCIKSVTVQLLWPVMLHQRLQLKQKTKQKLTKKINLKKKSRHRNMCPRWASTSAWSSCSARIPLEVPGKERKKQDMFSIKPR